jgi:hypothetical protein
VLPPLEELELLDEELEDELLGEPELLELEELLEDEELLELDELLEDPELLELVDEEVLAPPLEELPPHPAKATASSKELTCGADSLTRERA